MYDYCYTPPVAGRPIMLLSAIRYEESNAQSGLTNMTFCRLRRERHSTGLTEQQVAYSQAYLLYLISYLKKLIYQQ